MKGWERMRSKMNVIICPENICAVVVVSWETWQHQALPFALIEASNQGVGFHLPQGVPCLTTNFSNTQLAVHPKHSRHCTNNRIIKQVGMRVWMQLFMFSPSLAMWKIQGRFLGEGGISSSSALCTAVKRTLLLLSRVQCQTKWL